MSVLTEAIDQAESAPSTIDAFRIDESPALVFSPGISISRDGLKHLKRAGFLTVLGLVNAGVAFMTLELARIMVDGVLVKGPYNTLCAAASVAVLFMTLMSRPDRQRAPGCYLEEWIEAAKEALVVGVVLVIVAFLWRPAPIAEFSFSRGTVLATVPMVFVLIGIFRSAERLLLLKMRTRGHNLASVVVIGGGRSATAFIRTINDAAGTGYRVVAHVPDPSPTVDVVRTMHHLCETLTIDEVVIASSQLTAIQMQALVAEPCLRGVRIRAVPELFGLPPSKVQMVSFANFPLLTLFENPVRGARWKLKRMSDVAAAAVILTVLSPILAGIAAAIRFTSEGPVLFRQIRTGMDGKLIEVLKFRTMFTGAPEAVHRDYMQTMLTSGDVPAVSTNGFYKVTNDPRVTTVGRFLRRFSLDEVPQLFNVLRGEMSLVGPRPAIPYEVEFYEDWQRRRFDVLPGMTGLWQVSGRSRLSPADMLRLDVHYAETWSLPMDLRIILRTIPAVLRDDAR